MKISKYWYKENQLAKDNEDNVFNLNCWAGSNVSVEDAQEKARARIQKWTTRLAQGLSIGGDNNSDADYEYQTGEIREELLEEIYNEDQRLIAALTRNRYGALVLNTDTLVIADVDIKSKTIGEIFAGWFGKKVDKRAQCLAQIKACYQHYPHLNFIIYQTYAGFRVMITGHHHSPAATQTAALFKELAADELYARLCRVQDCFRARLSPKPWRCQATVPPHRFPRLTEEQQTAFANWQRDYETRSQKYAVCYKIEQLGKHYISPEVDKILTLHDAYVLKSKPLPLA
jgi:hypothetical protein